MSETLFYRYLLTELPPFGFYFSLPKLCDPRYDELPYCIRLLLENAVRCCDGIHVTSQDVENILNYKISSDSQSEISFKPSRVLLQDFTGVPALVDLAALRDCVNNLKGDINLVNPLVPVNLIVDHSIQVDYSRVPEALQKNQTLEFERNHERFAFLKWASKAFQNISIMPPGSGIVHQVNLEYLSPVVFEKDRLLYPDSVVGTDSHTTMIDGLSVLGWGVGGIEAEAVMLGEPVRMVLPQVIGFHLINELPIGSTATDLVLTITKIIREKNVVGKFIEFYGYGCQTLTIADRATIANMAPEYGATIGFFPADKQTLLYLRQTGRSEESLQRIEQYLTCQGLMQQYNETEKKIYYSGGTLHLDLATVVSCCSGPKRPQDTVPLDSMVSNFQKCLTNKLGLHGFGIPPDLCDVSVQLTRNSINYTLEHGSIVIAAITSCTNTSNPSVMLGAGLLAKHAVEAGLNVRPYIKTSLSPGSTVVEQYLKNSGVLFYLEKLGFYITGFGCQTCIGNSGPLDPDITEAVTKANLVVGSVLSGNRNFEGRIHPLSRANYLMSPMLVVAYALMGSLKKDFVTHPLGLSCYTNQPVFLKDIWPQKDVIQEAERKYVIPELYKRCYKKLTSEESSQWKELRISDSKLFSWNNSSTYIHSPPFFKHLTLNLQPLNDIVDACCLVFLGDSVTTDHISPAGSIAPNSPAGKFLESHGVNRIDFNTYGSRRGHDEIMTRGTFANIRLINLLVSKVGPYTIHIPSNQEMFIYDAAKMYKDEGIDMIVLAGREYGTGSSRDWAAKGPYLLGIKAVLAESFERIHRTNLVGMGILPLQFINESASSLNLTGKESFSISLTEKNLEMRSIIKVTVKRPSLQTFTFYTQARLETEMELKYFKHEGILRYIARKLIHTV